MSKFQKAISMVSAVCLLATICVIHSRKSEVYAVETPPTLNDFWYGKADFELYYNRPIDLDEWSAGAGTDIEVVGTTWYWFQRYSVPGMDQIGMECRSSTDKGQTWTNAVKVLEPSSSCPYITDGDFIYDSENNKWRCIIQTYYTSQNAWSMSYFERAGSNPMGTFTTPSGFTNPAVDNKEIWSQITTSYGRHCVDIPGGTNLVYDEGTPQIVTKVGSTYYVTFHGASGTSLPIRGYRGIAATTDFQNWTAAVSDCIQDQYDCSGWDVAWQDGGNIGVGASSTIKEGNYWYTMIEAADKSLTGTSGQNWAFGLMRSTSLTNTNWENYPNNPVFNPHKEICEWQYAQLFKDADGITYCAINKANPSTERAFQIYRLVWKSRVLDTCTGINGWSGAESVYLDYTSLDSCDSISAWTGTDSVSLDTINKQEGTGCLTSTGGGTEWFLKTFSTPVNTGVTETNGYVKLWVYISDVSKILGEGQIEIGSSGTCDQNEYAWALSGITLINGWNELTLKISEAMKTGSPNLSSINWFRIYSGLSGSVTKKVDGIRFVNGLTSTGSGNIWFQKSFSTPLDTGVTQANGYLKLRVYISDASKLSGSGQIEVGSSGTYDQNEYSWTISASSLATGWNDLVLKISSAAKIGSPNLASINWFRIYNGLSATITRKIDSIYFTSINPPYLDKCRSEVGWSGSDAIFAGTRLDTCDSISGWSGSDSVSLDTTNKKEGSGCLTSTGSGVEWFKKSFSTSLNTEVNESDGYVVLWLYISDASKFTGTGQIEIGSSGIYDQNEYAWSISGLMLRTGWNEVTLKISEAVKTGSPNLSAINWFRVYQELSGSVTKRLDRIHFVKADTQLTSVGSGTEWFKISYPSHTDSGVTEGNGYLRLSLYISDVSKFNGDGQIEIGSSGVYDQNEYSWALSGISLTNGWNTLELKLSSASKIGSPDLRRINWFRIYRPLNGSITRKVKDIYFHY